jgi:hypothetical protein
MKDLDRTDVRPLTEARPAEIEAQAKEFLKLGNVHPEGTGLNNNGILWMIGEIKQLKKQLVAMDARLLEETGVAAERRRCAAIARDYGQSRPPPSGNEFLDRHHGECAASSSIAYMIEHPGLRAPAQCFHRFFRYIPRTLRTVPSLSYAAEAVASAIGPAYERVRQCTTCGAEATDLQATANGSHVSYDRDGRRGRDLAALERGF